MCVNPEMSDIFYLFWPNRNVLTLSPRLKGETVSGIDSFLKSEISSFDQLMGSMGGASVSAMTRPAVKPVITTATGAQRARYCRKSCCQQKI